MGQITTVRGGQYEQWAPGRVCGESGGDAAGREKAGQDRLVGGCSPLKFAWQKPVVYLLWRVLNYVWAVALANPHPSHWFGFSGPHQEEFLTSSPATLAWSIHGYP